MRFHSQHSLQSLLPFSKLADFSVLITVIEVVTDLTVIFLAVLCGYGFYIWLNMVEPDWTSCMTLATVISLISFLLFEFFGLYKKQLSLMNLIEIRKIIQSVSTLFLLIVIFYVLVQPDYPVEILLYSSVTILAFVLTERMLIFKLQQSLHKSGINISRIMIIGTGEEARLIYQYITQAPKYGYKIIGFINPDNHKQIKEVQPKFDGQDIVFINNFEDFNKQIDSSQVNELWICSPAHKLNSDTLLQIQKSCQNNGIILRFAPFLSGYYPGKIKITDIGGIPLISFESTSQNLIDLACKRLFDLVIAFCLLLFFAPLFPIISFLIHKNSSGQTIFKQERVGKDGVLFTMFKFRTMFPDSPAYENSPKSSNEARITTLGKFLRKTSLDELPQLFNVLRGDMSIVGPRPEMPFIVENEYDDFLRQRLQVKPGITGVWQISGDRTKEIHENISYDIFYIANRSLLLDVIILIRTLTFAVMSMKTY